MYIHIYINMYIYSCILNLLCVFVFLHECFEVHRELLAKALYTHEHK